MTANNTLIDNDCGFALAYSQNNTIAANIIERNGCGISMMVSSLNKLSRNILKANRDNFINERLP